MKSGDRLIATIKGNLLLGTTHSMGNFIQPRQYAMWKYLDGTRYPAEAPLRNCKGIWQMIGRN